MRAEIDTGPPAPCPVPFNLAAHVLALASDHPDRIALQIVGPQRAESWSYARLEAAVRGTAGALTATRLVPGARVLLRLGNSVDFPVAFLGCIAAGLVPVPSSAQLTAAEVTAMARGLAPALILAAPGIALPDAGDTPVIGLDTLRGWRDHPPADYLMGAPERAAFIIYSSGSGGTPRGVVHAHRAVWARRMMWDDWYGLRAGDRIMHAGAFNWTYTLGTGLLDPWAAGLTALVPAEGVTPEGLARLVRRHDVTIFASSPGIYRKILKSRERLDLPRLRHALSAGEKLPEATRAAWRAAMGREIHEALGMSECSTFVSGAPDRPAPEGALGHAQTGRRIAVIGEDGRPVARGVPGTLAVHRRDPGLFLGYLDAPAETAARFSGDWFLTGDSVTMAQDGAITYLGREDDMMNAGGLRVSPVEVEAALGAHPEIVECAACEIAVKPDVRVIAAFYVAAREIPQDELDAFAAARLARYKRPRLYRRIARLPRGANNKILRRALRAGPEAEGG